MFQQVQIESKVHVMEFQILEIPAILVRHKTNQGFLDEPVRVAIEVQSLNDWS